MKSIYYLNNLRRSNVCISFEWHITTELFAVVLNKAQGTRIQSQHQAKLNKPVIQVKVHSFICSKLL